jgi:hypothetical protein
MRFCVHSPGLLHFANDGDFLTDGVAAPPPLFLMAQPAPELLLSELDRFSQKNFISQTGWRVELILTG